MLRNVLIDPRTLSQLPPEDLKVFAQFLATTQAGVLQKTQAGALQNEKKEIKEEIKEKIEKTPKESYQAQAFNFGLTHSLILDQENKDPNTKNYYVISNDVDDEIGKGSFARARKIIGVIKVNTKDTSIVYVPDNKKIVKITPTQESYLKNRAIRKDRKQNKKEIPLKCLKYTIGQAIQEYEHCAVFDHLGAQKPFEVKKQLIVGNQLKFFPKSYSIMNLLPSSAGGQPLLDHLVDIHNNVDDLTTLDVIDWVVLPTLIAYEREVASKGYAHRDIKNGNVVADILPRMTNNPENAIPYTIPYRGSKASFIDFGDSLKLGVPDLLFGTPGYVPPEVNEIVEQKKSIPVAQQRDLFGLGVLLMACFLPYLDPDKYIREDLGGCTDYAANEVFTAKIRADGCFNPDNLTSINPEANLCPDGKYNLFQNLMQSDYVLVNNDDKKYSEIENQYRVIKNLFREMTNVDPTKRQDIHYFINQFTAIKERLNQLLPKNENQAPKSPNLTPRKNIN